MRLRLDSYRRETSRLERRALVGFVLGGLAALVFSAAGLISFLLFIVPPDNEEWSLWGGRSGLVIGFVDLAGPGVAAVLFLRMALRSRRDLEALRQLAVVARQRSDFDGRDLARAFGVGPAVAERAILSAVERGVLEGAATSAVAEDPDGFVGRVLNDTYRLDALVGRGGMGAVFAATHLRTGRRYALKTLLPTLATSAEAIRRFEREATAATALGHPCIVAVHDVHETPDGLRYLVMDLLVGETLEQALARLGTLPWPVARAIANDVGSALSAAHAAGLVHRDVKPANVFLQAAPARAVLLDFGLVKPIDGPGTKVTRSGASVGTPLYMAPEQARGEPIDARADLHALAAVLFEMLAGTPPFFEDTVAAAYARLLTQDAPRLASAASTPLPPGLDEVLARALARSRDDRHPSVTAFLEALPRG